MIQPITGVGFFCQDIREEAGGIESLMGVLPDNIEVPSVDVIIPRICTYSRVVLDLETEVGELTSILYATDNSIISETAFDTALVEKARAEARAEGNTVATIIFKSVMANLPVAQAGRLRMLLKSSIGELTLGSLKIKLPQQDSEGA